MKKLNVESFFQVQGQSFFLHIPRLIRVSSPSHFLTALLSIDIFTTFHFPVQKYNGKFGNTEDLIAWNDIT